MVRTSSAWDARNAQDGTHRPESRSALPRRACRFWLKASICILTMSMVKPIPTYSQSYRGIGLCARLEIVLARFKRKKLRASRAGAARLYRKQLHRSIDQKRRGRQRAAARLSKPRTSTRLAAKRNGADQLGPGGADPRAAREGAGWRGAPAAEIKVGARTA